MVNNKSATADGAKGEGRLPKQGQAKSGFFGFLSGDAGRGGKALTPYLPNELVGGSVPHVLGTENEAVWNAAAQACGTERVHYCYTVDEGRVWYLATPSSALGSFPASWCPLAAALPGNSEYWDKETVYLYEQEGQASALRWDPETHRMQLFLGPARTILPKIQSMDANFVTINPEMADTVAWTNYSLRTDMLSRMAGRILLYSGLVACAIVATFIATIHVRANLLEPKLEQAKIETQAAAELLLTRARDQFKNAATEHMIRIQELLDTLVQIEGTLVRYEVFPDGRVEWDALVPRSFSAGDHPKLRNVTTIGGLEKDGRVRIRGTR